MKKIFGIIVSLCLIYGYVFSANTTINDCWIVSVNTGGNYRFLPQDYQNIYSTGDMIKVFDNLRKACVSNGVDNISNANLDTNDNYPDSLFLFDHLLDVYLRKLDAKGADEIGGDLMYGLNPDPKGKERRDFILSMGNSTQGAIPLEISNKYKEYWEGTITIDKYPDSNTQNDIDIWKSGVSGSIINYEDWTLYDKYFNACNIVMYITIQEADPVNNWKSMLNGTQFNKLQDIYTSCTALIDNRIIAEKDYTQTIALQKGTTMLDDTLNTYMNTFFVEDKLNNLYNKAFERSALFTEIVNGISRLVHKCN